jgi:hypothetical protein
MIKKIFIYTILLLVLSCSNDDDNQNNQSNLEGVWLLQNIPTGAKLTFQGQNWILNSGTVEMSGTFSLVGNSMSGKVENRSGLGSNLIQPDSFTGVVEIENSKATFTNFSGNWRAPFSSWYGKQ